MSKVIGIIGRRDARRDSNARRIAASAGIEWITRHASCEGRNFFPSGAEQRIAH